MTIHALGPFRLDTQDDLLFRGSEPAALGRRAIALLRTLAERPGALVCLPDGRWFDAGRGTWRNGRGRPARWPDLVDLARIRHTQVRRGFAGRRSGSTWLPALPTSRGPHGRQSRADLGVGFHRARLHRLALPTGQPSWRARDARRRRCLGRTTTVRSEMAKMHSLVVTGPFSGTPMDRSSARIRGGSTGRRMPRAMA
jgi:hypothetical protein